MKVILIQDMENLGSAGDIVEVAKGYGRNFLIPRNLAVVASTRNIKKLEHQKNMVEAKVRKESEKSRSLLEKVDGQELIVRANVGEEGKLFGSVTSADIAEELGKLGFDIDRKQIVLDTAIRSIGEHRMKVRVSSGLFAEIVVTVVPEE
ncbi:MAG: 50S ribosomal protein L9 [Deltaproteobacteria bacterium]|nr:50S ribosomal protein L9 [Deltaproteobacteria bacterium]